MAPGVPSSWRSDRTARCRIKYHYFIIVTLTVFINWAARYQQYPCNLSALPVVRTILLVHFSPIRALWMATRSYVSVYFSRLLNVPISDADFERKNLRRWARCWRTGRALVVGLKKLCLSSDGLICIFACSNSSLWQKALPWRRCLFGLPWLENRLNKIAPHFLSPVRARIATTNLGVFSYFVAALSIAGSPHSSTGSRQDTVSPCQPTTTLSLC